MPSSCRASAGAIRSGGATGSRAVARGAGGIACTIGGAASSAGGRFAPTPVGGEGRAFMAEAWRLDDAKYETYGPHLAVSGFV